MEKANKEVNDKKATGDDVIPGDALKVLGECSIRIIIQLISNVYNPVAQEFY